MKDAESFILKDMIKPSCLYQEWDKIAGHEDTRLRIYKVLQIDEKTRNKSFKPKAPKVGVLLYGPPHCGKSTMVQATAKFTKSHLIKVSPDTFAGRSYEEHHRLAMAVKSLALKYRPSIVLFENLDCFFCSEKVEEMNLSKSLKSQVLVMLDDLLSPKLEDIYLMATASNREDIDEEILTRFQVSINVPLPSFGQRASIIRKILEEEPTSDDINVKQLSMLTIGLNSGELQQLCRTAALFRIKDCLENNPWIDTKCCRTREELKVSKPLIVRPINMQDMRIALVEMRKQENIRKFSDLRRPSRKSSYNTFRSS